MSVLCPYCGIELSPPPKKKKLCKNCGNYVYVRGSQDLLPGSCFTFETAIAIDAYKENFYLYGLTKNEYSRYENILANKKGVRPSPVNIVWEVMKDAARNNHGVYYGMALLLGRLGKDPNPALLRHAQGELIELKKNGYEKVKILSSDGCSSCKNQKKKYAIAEALQSMPVPNKKCSYMMFSDEFAFCRCMYLPVLDSDE